MGSSVVSIQQPVEQRAGVTMRSDGGWYQDNVAPLNEADDLITTVRNTTLFVCFAVATELLLLTFSQTQT